MPQRRSDGWSTLDRSVFVWGALLILLSVGARGLFAAELPSALGHEYLDLPYIDGLRDHFWEYVFFSHRKPPFHNILHAAPAWFFTNAELSRYDIYIHLIGVMDVVAIFFLYRASLLAGAWPPLAFAFLGLFSFCLIPYGLHFGSYDRPNVFLFSFFLYACAVFVRHRARGAWVLSISGALCILGSTVSALIVPMMVVLVAALFPLTDSWKSKIRGIVVALSLPILMLTLLVTKNVHNANVWATANGAGHANVLFAIQLNDWKTQRVRDLLVESGAPEWYLWCFDHPEPMDSTPDMIYARSLGACGRMIGDYGAEDYPFDFKPVLNHLRLSGNSGMEALVREDMKTAREKPYLFTEFGLMQTSWFAAFGRESTRFARYVFWKDPLAWIHHAELIHNNMWVPLGPERLGTYVGQYWNHSRSPQVVWESTFSKTCRIFGRWVRGAYRIIPWILVVMIGALAASPLFRWISLRPATSIGLAWAVAHVLAVADTMVAFRKPGTNVREAFNSGIRTRFAEGRLTCLAMRKETVAGILYTVVPTLVMMAVFVGTVGTENERFFLQVLPHLSLLLVLIGSRILYVLGRSLKPSRVGQWIVSSFERCEIEK